MSTMLAVGPGIFISIVTDASVCDDDLHPDSTSGLLRGIGK